MSTCIAVESFAGLQLREPIPYPKRFQRAQRPDVRLSLLTRKRWGRGIVLDTTTNFRRVYFQKEDSGLEFNDFWFPRTSAIARELRHGRRRFARLGSGKGAQFLCQDVNPHRDEPLEVVPLCEVRVSDDALEGALEFCRAHYFPQAGYGRSLPKGVTHWDIYTNTYVTECIGCVTPKRGAAHATISNADFDNAVRKSNLSPEYRAGLRLALVSGWTYKDGAAKSGEKFSTFRSQAQRILRKSPRKEAFVPKELRFQTEQFAKGFGELGEVVLGDRRIPKLSGNREVPYDDGQALNDEFESMQNIFEGD